MMKRLLTLSLASCLLMCFQCNKGETPGPDACLVKATVVDLTGLDGCGMMFQLEDGVRLNPVIINYVKAPSAEERALDPLYGFQWEAGKMVRLSYDVVEDVPNTCMAGKRVKITCISELPAVAGENQ